MVQIGVQESQKLLNTGVQQLVSSGLKALTGRRNQNQGSEATVQQGDASTTVNASSVNVLDDPNSRTNTTLEYGAVDPNALLLSELGSRVPRFGTSTVLGGSSPTQNTNVTGIVPNAPPRLNTSDASGTSSVHTGPSNVQGATATASNTGVVGTITDAPSPRQNTQSTETHQLQQTLRDSANQQVRMYSSTQDSRDNASVYSAQGANNAPTIVETVQEGDLEDSLEEYQDSLEVVNLGDEVRIDLHNNTDSGYDSGLRDLMVNTDDPGQANS